jgi:hypothetical protein
MKTYGGVDVQIHVFLTSALEGEWSASRSCCFILGIHRIGGWVDPRAGLDDIEKRKFSTLPGIELRHLCCPASSYTDCATVVPLNFINIIIPRVSCHTQTLSEGKAVGHCSIVH